MGSLHRILYVADRSADGSVGEVSHRLEAGVGAATVEEADAGGYRAAFSEGSDGVDAVVTEHGPDTEVGRALVAFVRERAPDVPLVAFSSCDAATADAAGVEFVQRKNGASVDVLAETLRDRLGVDGGGLHTVSNRPQLEAVVEAAGDCILTVDDESVVRFVNPAVEDVFGYEPAELIGRPLTVLMSDDDAEDHLAALDRYLETGERTLDWDSVRLDGRHADGRAIPIEVSFAEFVVDDDHFFTGIVRDRSEQERRESELRRYETVMDTVDDGIYALDADDRFVAVNDAYLEMVGYSREELLGTPAETVTGEPLAGDVERIRAALAGDGEGEGENTVTVELDLPTRDGGRIPVEVRASQFPLGNGEYGRVGVVRDVSERERLETELSDALERITDAFFGLNEDWEFTYVNEQAERVLQKSAAELLGESVWEQFPAAVDSTFQREYERAMETQESTSFEEYYPPPLDKWFEVNAYPSPSGLSVYFRDVTERVGTEQELEARLVQQEAIADLGRTALRASDLDDLMAEAARLVADGLDNEFCEILDFDPASDELLLRQGAGWRDGTVGSATVPADENSQAGYTLQSQDPVVVEDLDSEDRFRGPELLTSHDVTSGITTFVGPYDNPWGIIGSHDTERKSFSEQDVAFVQSVANLLWTAIERRELETTLRRERDLSRLVVDTAPVGIVVMNDAGDVTMVNERAAEIAGVSQERLVEGGLGLQFLDPSGAELTAEELPFGRVREGGEAVSDVELGVVRPDDELRWVSVNGSRLAADEERTLSVFTVEDVTEVRNRAKRLAALNDRLGRLPDAETPEGVCTAVVEAATEALDLPRSYVALYDDEEGVLRPTAESEAAEPLVDSALLTDTQDSPVWTSFVRDEPRVVDDFAAEVDGESPLGGVAVFPLGTHGVFVVLAPESEGFSDTDTLLAEMLASTVRSALDRAAREADLRTHRDDLAEKNERLDRLNRVNRAIRDITQVLLQADSHDSVESLVCERLVDIEPYSFAWVGHADRAAGEVVAATSAGDGEGYLDRISVPLDDSERVGPIARAVETGTAQVQNDILNGAAFEPWREEALSRGFRSCVTVPLQHRDNLHGVLTIYAEKPHVFDEMEAAVLTELGETIGYAMNAIDRKRALVSENSTELKFDVSTVDTPLFGFLRGTEGRFALESTVHRLDDHTHVFFRAEGVDGKSIRDEAARSPEVEGVHVISDDEEGCLFECTVRGSQFLSDLIERGALLSGVDVSNRRATITLRVPTSVDARSFIGYFEETFGDVTLLARRELDEPVMTRRRFENEVRDRLTERQTEVIQTAYFSGFFEWPRESNGQEVAEILGVTQPTVNRHIRAGERTLFGLLFGDADPDLA